jgi:hypothetical protein
MTIARPNITAQEEVEPAVHSADSTTGDQPCVGGGAGRPGSWAECAMNLAVCNKNNKLILGLDVL